MSIQVSHISKSYGATPAVKDISFDIKAGEITGFLGPNGAGKSTCLQILMGLLEADQGSASILGLSVQSEIDTIKKQVGYLAEHNPLYPDMYVKEFLTFIGKIHQIPADRLKKRIEEVIELTGLTQEQTKKIHALSKGYQQRVGIAQAILHDPKVLLLDEPTSGLDPNQMEEIRSLIKSLAKQKTILFSSHILSEVEAICDRIILINQGELKANCSLKEAQEHPGGLAAFFKKNTTNA
ncbi:MAG: Sulfate-transporting ATPase [Bacteroidota bacterium]